MVTVRVQSELGTSQIPDLVTFNVTLEFKFTPPWLKKQAQNIEYSLNLSQLQNKTCQFTGAIAFGSGVLKSLPKTGTEAFEKSDLKFVLLCSKHIVYRSYLLFYLVRSFCFTKSQVKMSGSDAIVWVLF